MGKSRRKKSKPSLDKEVDSDAPRILVIRRGIVSHEIKQLAHNLRLILSPNCAVRLKEGSKQRLRDFTTVTDVLGLTHLIVLSQSSNGSYLKIASLPKGPTLTFLIDKLSLISDITNSVNNPQSFDPSVHSPLLVLNGFPKKMINTDTNKSSKSSLDLDSVLTYVVDTLNNMIAPIDVSTAKIQNCKRVILFHKQKDGTIVLRHYSINLVDCNTPSHLKDLLTLKTMKNILTQSSDFQEISNYLSTDSMRKNNYNLDSETDEVVELDNLSPQNVIAMNKYGVDLDSGLNGDKSNKVGIKLIEIGPRVLLTLIKVQDDVFTGSVPYHKFVTKTAEELEENKKLEPTIVNKRKLESERVMNIYKKYLKKSNDSAHKSGKVEDKEDKNVKP